MENFDQIFTLIAYEEGISLNLNILETGLINIIALIVILASFAKDFLGSLLKARKKKIVDDVTGAENSLNDAKVRLAEARNQLKQASLVINEITANTLKKKKAMLETDAFETKKDLKIRFERAIKAFKSEERQIFLEIKEQITSLVLSRIVSRVKTKFANDKIAYYFINNSIIRIKTKYLTNYE